MTARVQVDEANRLGEDQPSRRAAKALLQLVRKLGDVAVRR